MAKALRLRIRRELCSGCRLCEMACSLSHLGLVNTNRSAIRVFKDDLDTGACRPAVCVQCKKMLCLGEGDAAAEEYKGRFLWDRALEGSCPFDALPAWNGEVYHCDLCGGDPACVKFCSTGAIRI
ncbi:MAG: hypothetical protein JRH06_04435 [Deltaproteobacteria bacterium]|nr:hypothetical protein [Deltaproteobacteria bacterium]MBW2136787.1 hypothetical protein [Deltaproteobacteria bacterium]